MKYVLQGHCILKWCIINIQNRQTYEQNADQYLPGPSKDGQVGINAKGQQAFFSECEILYS